MCTIVIPHASSYSFLQRILVCHAQTAPQLAGEALVTLLAHWLLIVFVKFRLLVHFIVANRARKMMYTPGLVQSGEY